MKITTQILLLFLVGATLSSCSVTYGDYDYGEYTRIDSIHCIDPPASIYLFYEGEPLDFEYVKLGEVESSGAKHSSNASVLDHLKYKAWINCANGLINVSAGYRDREQGTLFHSDLEEIYSSRYYHAIAVQIETDSAFVSKYGLGMDTGFVKTVETYKEEVSKEKSNQFAISTVGIIVLVALVLVLAGSGS